MQCIWFLFCIEIDLFVHEIQILLLISINFKTNKKKLETQLFGKCAILLPIHESWTMPICNVHYLLWNTIIGTQKRFFSFSQENLKKMIYQSDTK